jgi:hypothetical protein
MMYSIRYAEVRGRGVRTRGRGVNIRASQQWLPPRFGRSEVFRTLQPPHM